MIKEIGKNQRSHHCLWDCKDLTKIDETHKKITQNYLGPKPLLGICGSGKNEEIL